MEWLKIVAKDHKEWVKLVQSFGEDFFSEDIVQESYIRLYKYCKPEKGKTKSKCAIDAAAAQLAAKKDKK